MVILPIFYRQWDIVLYSPILLYSMNSIANTVIMEFKACLEIRRPFDRMSRPMLSLLFHCLTSCNDLSEYNHTGITRVWQG